MQHTRWYMFCPQTGKKIIRRFDVDATPPSPWMRGTGPHSAEARAKIAEYNRIHFKDKPKSAETRQKMRDAKLGKKNSKEHCAKIAQAWADKRIERRERNQEAMRIAMSSIMGNS